MRRARWVAGAVTLILILSSASALGITRAATKTVEVRGTDLKLEAFASVARVPRQGIAEVRARVQGTVRDVAVREGDHVRAGQILAVIDAPGSRSEVRQREAERDEALAKLQALGAGNLGAARALAARGVAVQSEQAAADAKLHSQERLREHGAISDAAAEQTRLAAEGARARYKALLADSTLTLGVQRPSELRAARARLSAAEAALDQARITLSLGEVTSSISGVVLSRRLNPGDVLTPATSGLLPIFEIADCSDVVLRGELDELDGERVHVGLPVNVYALGGTKPVATGWVQHQGARLERRALGYADPRESLVRPIWLEVRWASASGALGPIGERFEARIQLPSKRVGAAVPRAALAIRDGVASVEVSWGPFWRRVPVRLGLTDPLFAEIGGLQTGTQVRLSD